MNVLALIDHYVPGFRMGGPVRSLTNLVEALSDEIAFSVLTLDRDFGSMTPYPGVVADTWLPVGPAQVFYSSRRLWSPTVLRKAVKQACPDVVYLNSFFSVASVMMLAWSRAGVIPKVPMVLAPRGEFSPGALRLEQRKKSAYLSLAKRLGLYRDVTWHASTPFEAADIRAMWGDETAISIASNLFSTKPIQHSGPDKSPGACRFVFISRISPMKNLLGAIRMLQRVEGSIVFDVFGAVDDDVYWRECEEAAAGLPANITFSYMGQIPNEEVASTLGRYHFFLLPTLGENFGHAIVEALRAGRPVLISDRTPWRGLYDANAGWDLALQDLSAWGKALTRCVEMETHDYRSMCVAAQQLPQRWLALSNPREQNLRMFRDLGGSIGYQDGTALVAGDV